MTVRRKKISPAKIGFLLGMAVFYSAVWPVSSFSQSAALLPMAQQQFLDNNGNPLSTGTVGFYYPSTLNLKPIWQDAAEATPYTNPVSLNSAGRPPGSQGIYGQGAYRQIVKDVNGNTIWDALTSSAGSSSGTAATGDGDLVGTVKPWAGITAPNQYQFAYGQQLSRTTFAALFTAITLSTAVTCTSASNTLSGIADTTSIPIGAHLELAACVTPGTTVSSKTASTVVMSNPSSVSLNTTAVFFPFGNGDGSTTFTLPDFRGNVIAGRPNMGGTASTNLTNTFCANPTAQGAVCGAQSETLARANLPNITYSPVFTGTLNPAATVSLNQANIVQQGGGGALTAGAAAFQTITPTVTVPAFTPAGTINTFPLNGGITQTAFATVQPTITLNYIIKVTPDTNSAIATGITDINGMVGSIACGAGLTCTGNTVSVQSLSNVVIGPVSSTSCFSALWNNTSGTLLGSIQPVAANPICYGADPTGVTDSAAALNAALAASSYVKFPPGHYKFLSLITYTLGSGVKSVTIEGSGQDVTFLDWTNGTSGIRINFNSGQSSAHVRDMTIETGSAVVGNGLLYILSTLNTLGSLSASSDVQNVTFRGNDGGGLTDAWAVALDLVNVSNITVFNTFFMGTSGHSGNGINFVGNSGLSSAAVVLNIVSSDFLDMSAGIIYGTWAQGLTVASSNFTAGATGINVPGSLPPLTQLSVVNSQFEVDQALSLNSLVSDVTIGSNLFIIGSAAAGIVLASTQDVSIVGNDFAGISTGSNVGVSIATTVANSGVAITSNSFHQLTNGINLTASTVSGVVAANNLFFSNTNNITNSSTATNNRIENNVGYNPVGVTAAATVGASPATITAGPTRETHYVKQSANFNAAITKSGNALCTTPSAAVPCVIDLGPNEAMVVTWTTTAPTDTKDVH